MFTSPNVSPKRKQLPLIAQSMDLYLDQVVSNNRKVSIEETTDQRIGGDSVITAYQEES